MTQQWMKIVLKRESKEVCGKVAAIKLSAVIEK
jgi:hypothetical protein